MNTYLFELTWYNADDEKEVKVKGLIPAYSYENAMQELSAYYGEDEICSINLEYINDNTVIEVPDHININDIRRMNEF